MRKIVVVVLMGLGACGCASPAAQQQAANQCQSVGFTEKDPEFAACTRAMLQQRREERIEESYHKALNIVPVERMTPHADVNVF